MATSSKAEMMSLKLLIDTKSNRFLFAEAGKDFVDFLFNLLHLPLGTVVSLLKEQPMAGTLGYLFESVQNLKETYFQTNKTKDSVLNPEIPFFATQVPLLSLPGSKFLAKTSYYTCRPKVNGTKDDIYIPVFYPRFSDNASDVCPSCGKGVSVVYHPYFSDKAGDVCPSCGKNMSEKSEYATAGKVAAVGEGGFVKGEATYMVTDNLEVTPMSTSAWIAMLNKFNVKEVGALEEKVVELGMPEALKVLNASLHSKKVLTSTFLAK